MLNPIMENEIEELPGVIEEARQGFQITDLASLTWALRKISAITAKKGEVNQVADNEIERVEAYRKKELEGLRQSEDFFRALINDYAIKRRDADPKFKSEKTPYGSIGFRKQQPKWNYDEETLVSFLEKNDHADLVRVKKEPVKTEIKKLFSIHEDGRVFDENGQSVEGITVEFQPDTLDVKTE